MDDNRSYNFEETEKMNRLDGLTTKGDEENPWADIDEVINIGRKTKLQSPRRDDFTKGIIAQRQDCVVTKQTITTGIVSTSQPVNGLVPGIASSLPEVEKTIVPNGLVPSIASSLPDVDKLDAPNKSARSLGFEMTGSTMVSPQTTDTRANAHVDNNDPKLGLRSTNKLDHKDSYPEDSTSAVNTDSPTGRNSITRTPESDSTGKQELGSNTEEETPKTSQHLNSGDGEYDKEKDMNPGSWLDRVPGEEIIDITARSKQVYTPYLIQRRDKKMAAARQRYVDRLKVHTIGQTTVPTDPSRRPNSRKRQGRYCSDILNDEERCQTEEYRPTEDHIRAMEQPWTEERRGAEQYRRAYFSSIPTECVEQLSKDSRISTPEYRRLACFDYSYPRAVTSATATREDRARLLKAPNDRRAKPRAEATELPSETTWCVGYDVWNSTNRTPSPAYFPGRYIPENHPQEENKSRRFRYSKKRSATVIKVVPRGDRNSAVITDNNTKTGPFRRGMRALRNGLRRVGQSLQGLMTACTCSSWDDIDL